MDNSNILLWRYATKKFDSSRKIPKAQLDELLEALRLAPSSFGLQPWKFIVVKNNALRKELKVHSWNQSQIVDASELIVLCALRGLDEAYIKNYVRQIANERSVPAESLKSYEDLMIGTVKNQTKEQVSEWMKRQVYIALGFLMYAASERRIDSCPMEGFDRNKYDEILKLEEKGLQSVVLCTVGYRAQDDAYARLRKFRFSSKEVLEITN
jgi:nitroreductase / dihydropteridine reductase